jgi:soluble lytic murein transglycosylase-like protein
MHARPKTLLRPGGLIVVGMLVVQGAWGWASSEPPIAPPNAPSSLERTLEMTRGELTIARLQFERASAVLDYATRYQIAADVAIDVYDIALAEGIDPGLAFRLVRVESNFVADATSSAGALGYTQILPSTARLYEPGLTTQQLYERRTNLRLGFRYLRDLLDRYEGEPRTGLKLALLAYNRGPARVQELLEAGQDPQNGYAAAIMGEYGRRDDRTDP